MYVYVCNIETLSHCNRANGWLLVSLIAPRSSMGQVHGSSSCKPPPSTTPHTRPMAYAEITFHPSPEVVLALLLTCIGTPVSLF